MSGVPGRREGWRVLETVCCLECGEIYAKPAQGTTVEKNPGCPACGYVGWIAVNSTSAPRRSFVDPTQHRPAQLH